MARKRLRNPDDEERSSKEEYTLPVNFVESFGSQQRDWESEITELIQKESSTKGSPGFNPGPEQSRQVEQLTALGMSPADISSVLRIEQKLLEKFYKYELDTTGARINAQVGKVALSMALSGSNADMTKFWLKTRAGWKETKEVQVTGQNGGPIQFQEVKKRMIDMIEAEVIDVEGERIE